MKNNLVRRIVFWTSSIVAVGCIGFAGWYHYSNYLAAKNHADLVSEVTVDETDQTQSAADEEAHTYTLEEIEAAEFTGEIEGEAPTIPSDVLTEARVLMDGAVRTLSQPEMEMGYRTT